MNGPIKALPGSTFLFYLGFNKWDKIVINGPMKIEEMKKFLEEKYKFELSMINYGKVTVYNSYFDANSADKLSMRIEEKIRKSALMSEKKRLIPLIAFGNTSDGIDCILPSICYKI